MLDNHIEVEVHSPQSNRPAVDIPFCSFLMRRMPDLESEAAETNETTMYCKVSVRFYVVLCCFMFVCACVASLVETLWNLTVQSSLARVQCNCCWCPSCLQDLQVILRHMSCFLFEKTQAHVKNCKEIKLSSPRKCVCFPVRLHHVQREEGKADATGEVWVQVLSFGPRILSRCVRRWDKT